MKIEIIVWLLSMAASGFVGAYYGPKLHEMFGGAAAVEKKWRTRAKALRAKGKEAAAVLTGEGE